MKSHKQIAPLYQGMTRPILLMGGERENIIILGAMAGMLCSAGKDVPSTLIAALLFFPGVLISKVVAKTDPWATKIFIKSLQYQGFYPAREKINTPKNIIKRSRKI
jgi:type IV secretion system protein TrbD